MIEFRKIKDDDTGLDHSPMLRAILKTAAYISEQGSIGLTPLKAFKRNFVHWAAAEFDWPGYSEKELFRLNKVFNEFDFLPLVYLHEMMILLKIGRHYKGSFKLTKAGHSLVDHPGNLFGVITPFYLFHLNHDYSDRQEHHLEGNWDIFFNVLNVEAEDGVSGSEVRKILYGDPRASENYDPLLWALYIKVLRPLCWAGLLHETRAPDLFRIEESIFTKTPLWRVALQLDTDPIVRSATRH